MAVSSKRAFGAPVGRDPEVQSNGKEDKVGRKDNFSLWVGNIPEELDSSGMKNLFSRYGNVLDVRWPHQNSTGRRYGFVEMISECDALKAIQGINGAPPLKLRVQMAASMDRKAKILKANIENTVNAQSSSDGESSQDEVLGHGRGNALSVIAEKHMAPTTRKLKDGFKSDQSFSTAVEDNNEKQLEFLHATALNAALLQRKVFGIDPMYFSNSKPWTCQFSECKSSGKYRCSRCKAWYCSHSCQYNDWTNHKIGCIAPPPLETNDGVPIRPNEHSSLRLPHSFPEPSKDQSIETPLSIEVGCDDGSAQKGHKTEVVASEMLNEEVRVATNFKKNEPPKSQEVMTKNNTTLQRVEVDGGKAPNAEEVKSLSKRPVFKVGKCVVSSAEPKLVTDIKECGLSQQHINTKSVKSKKDSEVESEVKKSQVDKDVEINRSTRGNQGSETGTGMKKSKFEVNLKAPTSIGSIKGSNPVTDKKKSSEHVQEHKSSEHLQPGKVSNSLSSNLDNTKKTEVKILDQEKKKIDHDQELNSSKRLQSGKASDALSSNPAITNEVTEAKKVNKEKKYVPKYKFIFDSLTDGLHEVFLDGEKSAQKFNGLFYHEDLAVYVLDDLANRIMSKPQNLPSSDIFPGKEIIFHEKQNAEDLYNRGIIIEDLGDGKVEVINVDFGTIRQISKGELFILPEDSFEKATLGLVFQSLKSDMTKEIASDIERMLMEDTIEFSLKMKEKGKVAKACVSGKNGDEVEFSVSPWTSADRRVAKLFNPCSPTKIFRKDFKDLEIKNKEQLLIVDFVSKSDLVVVQNHASCERAIELDDKIAAEFKDRSPVPVEAPEVGEMLACKWSSDDNYYRAEVLAVDKKRLKARVQFVDYGNIEIEKISNLVQLSGMVANPDFAICSKTIKLHGVPSIDIGHSTPNEASLKLNQLKPQLEVNFKARNITPDSYELIHPSGETLNKMVREKLCEPTTTFRCQGQVVGGGFDYDKCHVASIPVNPDVGEQGLYLLHCEDPLKIFFADPNQLSKSAGLDEMCNAYMRTKPSKFEPNLGRVCIAKSSENEWIRGVCIDKGDKTKCFVFYPDFGITEEVLVKNLYDISEELMAAPFLANHCILEGCEELESQPELRKKVKAVLVEHYGNRELSICKVVTLAKDDSIVTIRLPDIQNEVNKILKGKDMKEEEKCRQICELEAQLALLKQK